MKSELPSGTSHMQAQIRRTNVRLQVFNAVHNQPCLVRLLKENLKTVTVTVTMPERHNTVLFGA